MYLVLAPRSTTIQLIHGCEQQNGMLNCIATVAKSNQIHVFLLSRRITRIIGTIYHQYSNFYHQLGEYLNIRNIQTISHLYHKFSCRNTPNNPNIQDRTPTMQTFSNKTEYTLQLQASTQPTMLRMVLDHNPYALSTV